MRFIIPLLLVLGLLSGCKHEPSCSGDADHLCVRIESDGLPLPPELLTVTTTLTSPPAVVRSQVETFAVTDIFVDRGYFLYQVDLTGVPLARTLTLAVDARRGMQIIASAGAVGVAREAGNVTLRLKAGSSAADLAGGAGSDFATPPQDMNPAAPQRVLVFGRGTYTKISDVCYGGTRLYVSDRDAGRIAVYTGLQADGTAQGPVFVTGATAGMATTALQNPAGLWCDDAVGLLVADAGNHRVLFYPSPVTAASNAVVFGQASPNKGLLPNRNVGAAPIVGGGVNTPTGVAFDVGNQTVYVADSQNNRVLALKVNNLSQLNNPNNTGVIGQADLMSRGANGGAQGLTQPLAVSVEKATGRVAVTDSQNNRVMLYPATLAGQMAVTANGVVGQMTLNGMGSGAGDAALSTPTMARVIAGKLVVIDNGNRRMQIFNKVPDAGVNGSRADDTVGSDAEVIPAAVSAANLMLGDGGVGSFLIVADRGDARQPGIALYRIF